MLKNGANGDLKNGAGHPAKFGIDGDKDPEDPVNMLEGAKSASETENALEVMLARAQADKDKLDKAKVAMAGMKKKKDKAVWSAKCGDLFKEVMAAL